MLAFALGPGPGPAYCSPGPPTAESNLSHPGPGMASQSVLEPHRLSPWGSFQIQNRCPRFVPDTGASSLPFSCRVGGSDLCLETAPSFDYTR